LLDGVAVEMNRRSAIAAMAQSCAQSPHQSPAFPYNEALLLVDHQNHKKLDEQGTNVIHMAYNHHQEENLKISSSTKRGK